MLEGPSQPESPDRLTAPRDRLLFLPPLPHRGPVCVCVPQALPGPSPSEAHPVPWSWAGNGGRAGVLWGPQLRLCSRLHWVCVWGGRGEGQAEQ